MQVMWLCVLAVSLLFLFSSAESIWALNFVVMSIRFKLNTDIYRNLPCYFLINHTVRHILPSRLLFIMWLKVKDARRLTDIRMFSYYIGLKSYSCWRSLNSYGCSKICSSKIVSQKFFKRQNTIVVKKQNQESTFAGVFCPYPDHHWGQDSLAFFHPCSRENGQLFRRMFRETYASTWCIEWSCLARWRRLHLWRISYCNCWPPTETISLACHTYVDDRK
jgi:hypothetical protein